MMRLKADVQTWSRCALPVFLGMSGSPPAGISMACSCLHIVPASLMGAGLPHASGDGQAPPELSVPMRQAAGLRYGENPHQQAAFYTDQSLAEAGQGGIATAIQHHGKEVTTQSSSLHWRCQSASLWVQAARHARWHTSQSCMGARQHPKSCLDAADIRPDTCHAPGQNPEAACSPKPHSPSCSLTPSADCSRHLLLPADVLQQLPGR